MKKTTVWISVGILIVLISGCSNFFLFHPELDAKLWAWGTYLDSTKDFYAQILFRSIGTVPTTIASVKITPMNSSGQILPFYTLYDGTCYMVGRVLLQGEGLLSTVEVYTTAPEENAIPDYYMVEIVYWDAEHHSRKITIKSRQIDGIFKFE
jgi:hypothetical protein